ncbi:MAG TPA: ATP-binding cassette domain-containing protein [Propioniciclava sp.]|jgi:ABC-2 type transport system ATP-binding protein|uniref:ABC transporter ATP-binding protein n=1 Tax=Propioniciclava sp. TaxID=2038686 RepID=UPI002C6148F3|nr:ATP-binding cassette domain-containing protein [Propioniciclava sp.]HRL49614.1 ATP-binding cassette domain-containing protein [Propioniciclava sp.]
MMSHPAVRLDHLTCRFPRKGNDDLVAVNDFDLTIPMGQVYGLLGPNGSGKTTTVNVISALLPPTEGTCRVMGVDVRKDPSTVRSRIGVVPQETALYNDLSAQENLQFHARLYRAPRGERQHRIDEVLDLVGLSGRRKDRVGTFSGGMQRRLALARALLTRPDIIILDEPTLGVDVQSRNALWERIRAQADDGGTVLLTTNYMEEAQALADDLAIIDHGTLVATGAPDELRATLGRHYVHLHSDAPARWDELEQTEGIAEVRISGDQVRVEATGSHDPVRTVLDFAASHGITVQITSVRQPDLNDVFLALTGTTLRDQAA